METIHSEDTTMRSFGSQTKEYDKGSIQTSTGNGCQDKMGC